jgi:hypothetical protein
VLVEKCWVDGLTHQWPGHARPNAPVGSINPDGSALGSPARPPTDVDATRHTFDRFSALLG